MNVFSVYMISNDLNNKVYIGQTTKSIQERFYEHCTYYSSEIGKAIKSIGKEHFSISLLDDTSKTLDELTEKESFYIQKYDSVKNGYNSRPACKSNGKIANPKPHFTTMLDIKLLNQIKIQAIKEKRSVSDLLEELIAKYLEETAAE